MLVDPHATTDATMYIVGIDPGSTTMGVGVIGVDLETGLIVSSAARTLNANRLHTSALDEEVHSARYSRIFALAKALQEIFEEVRPTLVVCESPFMSRRQPLAYGALMETVYAVRLALRTYDSAISLDLVDPPTAKNAVGAKGNAGKEDVLKALVKLSDLLNYNAELSGVPIEKLDEHSSDSLAIAYWRYRRFMSL